MKTGYLRNFKTMRDWQQHHVLDNFDKLCSSTRCYAMLISTLITKKILDISEWDMASMKFVDRYTQADKLYEILMTRENSYEELYQVLHKTNQPIAVEILMKGFELSGHPIPPFPPNLHENFGGISNTPDFENPPAGVLDLTNRDQPKHFLIISATNAEITEIKIQQTIRLPSFPVHFPKSLNEFLNEQALDFEEHQMIVVTCHSKRAFKSALSDLRQRIREDKPLKIVIITEEPIEDVKRASTQFQIDLTRVNILTDDPQCKDLTNRGKLKLLHKQILLQGSCISLKDFCPDPNQLKMLSGKILADLLNDERPEMFSEVIPPLPKYYIQRKLRSKRCQVPLKVIEDSLSTDVFVISDIDINELRNFKSTSGCIAESTELIMEKNLSSQRFIVLAKQDHFEIICKKTSGPVHWLCYHKTHFEWLKTRGSISLMQEYTRDADVQLVGEKEFINQCEGYNDPILISDTPGTGKTMLCKSLALQLKHLHPSRLVLFITMSEFVSELSQLYANENRGQFKVEDFVQIIVQLTSDFNSFMQHQLKNWLSNDIFAVSKSLPSVVKCEILFDGYDEVLPHQRELAKQVLTWIGDHRKNVRVWVATRPAHMGQLEETLSILGNTIQPFDNSEAKEFLARYWLEETSGGKFVKNGDIRFQNALIKLAENWIQGLNSKLGHFEKGMTGIPLQCFMLAHIYEKEAVEFASAELSPQISPESQSAFISVNDVTELYVEMLSKKLTIFFGKRNINKIDTKCQIFLTQQRQMDKVHFRLSVELLYPKWSERMKIFLPFLTEEERSEVLSYGIVKSFNVNAQPRFVHRTFAEYYLALFMVNLVSESNKFENTVEAQNLIVAFLFSSVLQMTSVSDALNAIPHFRTTIVIHFLNEILYKKHHAFSPKLSLKKAISSYKHAKEVIIGCLTSGKPGIFQMLTSFFNRAELKNLLSLDTTSGAQILGLLSRHSSTLHFTNAVDFLNSLGIPIDKASFKGLLILAMKSGNVDIVQHIISTHLKPRDWENLHILHRCLKRSMFLNDPHEISKLQKVMRCLIAHNRSILEERDFQNHTPLISHKCIILTPYEMTDQLVKEGADVNATADDANVLYHLFLKIPASVEKQVNSFELLKKHKLNIAKMKSSIEKLDAYKLFTILTKSHHLPEIGKIANAIPHSAITELEPIGFNFKDLFFSHFHSLDHFRGILNHLKLKFSYVDKRGNNLLHLVMRFFMHTSADPVLEEIVEYLLSNGVNPNQTNNEGKTPLQSYMFPVSTRLLRSLKTHKGNILGKDECEIIQIYLQNLFVNMFRLPCDDVVSYLIDNGADINCKTKDDEESLLHLAVKVGCLDTVKFLTKTNPGLVNSTDKIGLSPLHVAVFGHLVRPVCVYDWLVERINPIEKVFKIDGEKDFLKSGSVSLWLNHQVQPLKNIKTAFHCSTHKRSQLLEIAAGITSDKHFLNFYRQLVFHCTESDESFIGSNDFEELPYAKCYERKKNLKIVRHLLENKAIVNSTSHIGNTSLNRVLFRAKNKFKGKDKFEGMLQWEQAFISVLNLLIDNKVDVHCANNDGKTCLHFASEAGMMKVVVILVEQCKVNVNIKDKEGNTALKYAEAAAELYNDEIIESVVEYLRQVEAESAAKDMSVK